MKWVCERKAYPKQIKNAPKNAESQRKDGPKAGQREGRGGEVGVAATISCHTLTSSQLQKKQQQQQHQQQHPGSKGKERSGDCVNKDENNVQQQETRDTRHEARATGNTE
ncbi:hypothetical protein AWZ03_000420 [Drosophila navojoa]|uniref:Uncharacterized protein n=1 Tax=Drosophila navojoa TaxID=7232 RepID=A0A484BVM0_DRONA|nr:hypothetical protein AWZ03_000420 [Drosophila navojoa]